MADASENMKVNIIFSIAKTAAGGGNQFLAALKEWLLASEYYEENPHRADVILFNSHHNIAQAAALKVKYPNKPFVHRIDGPMKVYNNPSDIRDNIVFAANKSLADATIFQSVWSQKANHNAALPVKKCETVIHNASDPQIFHKYGRLEFSANRKIHLIAASFSDNPNKGFDAYKWLDENLDFSKYKMTFIGNSPLIFKNIKQLPPMPSRELVQHFKQSDIYITASRNDPCSNALIEAMSCGLPAIGLAEGGHPELIGDGGELFTQPQEIPALIEKITANYSCYADAVQPPHIEEVGRAYYDFMQYVYENSPRKKFGKADYLSLMSKIAFHKITGKIKNAAKKHHSQ